MGETNLSIIYLKTQLIKGARRENSNQKRLNIQETQRVNNSRPGNQKRSHTQAHTHTSPWVQNAQKCTHAPTYT